jgi:hypothetical protein
LFLYQLRVTPGLVFETWEFLQFTASPAHECFVSGHGFSRAANPPKRNWEDRVRGEAALIMTSGHPADL